MPNSLIDLHFHSHYSDGRASPAEILRHAAGIGLKTLALTDHDTLRGVPEALNVAHQLGLELIPAVELTTRWELCPPDEGSTRGERDVDVLAYFIQLEDQVFQEYVEGIFQDTSARIAEACERLTASGYPLTVYDLLDENPRYPGAVQVFSAMQRKGYVRNRNEGNQLFQTAWSQVRQSQHTLTDTVKAIHQAGGVAVLAHPVSVDCGGGLLGEREMAYLKQAGMDGLEVYHPRLNSEDRRHFLEMAQRFDFLISGGSDDHGWPGGFPRLGTEIVTYEMVHALRKRAQERSQPSEH